MATKQQHPLVQKFKKAGLELRVLDKPLRTGRGMDEIVQLDVGRKVQGTRRHEWFNIYLGHDNDVQVRDVDSKSNQLLLLINEPLREFEETLPRWSVEREIKQRGSGWPDAFYKANNINPRDVVKRNDNEGLLILRRKTSGDTRYFLMGVDERQLFIAQLRNPATTVREAREQLGSSVTFAEGRRRGSAADRQGEWFFLETSQEQRDAIEKFVKGNRFVIHRKVNIGSFAGRAGGNPHVADELVAITNTTAVAYNKKAADLLFPVQQRQKVFVRGGIRHVDHKTIKFTQWREVIANNEGATARAQAEGVFFID